MHDETLDLRGLKCPLPVLRTRKALAGLAAGSILAVQCTDALAVIDVPHLLRQTGDELLDVRHDAGVVSFRIRKA